MDLQAVKVLFDLHVSPVTVEVQDVIGPSGGAGVAQLPGQRVERRRTQDVQFERLARSLVEPFEDAGRHRTEGHVVFLARPADDQEDPHGAGLLCAGPGRPLGIGLGADERVDK